MELNHIQEKIIDSLKNDFNEYEKNNINTASSSLSFIATWGENIGFEKLKLNHLNISSKFELIKIILKDLYTAIKFSEITYLENSTIKNQNKIILSTASIKDFNEEGSYFDRYLRIDSNNYTNYIFLLLYGSKSLPKKIDQNIIIFNKKKNFVKGVSMLLISLIKYFCWNLSLKNFLHHFSDQTNFAKNFSNSIKNKIDFKKISSILVPFEGIPYQQEIFFEIKKINQKILTIGYDHSAPHAMPLNMYYRMGSPDFLIVNGSSQIYHLTKFLNWPQKKLIELPSLRYSKDSKEEFKNTLFLPWKIFNSKKILEDFELFLKKLPEKSLQPLKVKTHPICVNKKSQDNFKNEIEKIINKYSIKFTKNLEAELISIFIGSTTGVIVALEKGLKILHICFDPIFDSYSEFLWPRLKVKKLTNNSFIYSLKEKGTFIKFGEGKKTFDNFYSNFDK